jgi:riboflavin synthase
MFTGLIEDLGTLRQIRRGGESVRLVVATGIPMGELTTGESIAVNGICLTVTSFGDGTFTADVSPETLIRTTLGELQRGNPVNLERALRLSDRLGGHMVSGHVDGIGTILERVQDRNAIRFSCRVPADISRFLVEKGSVAIDGISLTVNEIKGDTFSVAVIPHTLAVTTLRDRVVGSRVNIETDIIGKYVEKFLRGKEGDDGKDSLDLQFLAKHGFI